MRQRDALPHRERACLISVYSATMHVEDVINVDAAAASADGPHVPTLKSQPLIAAICSRLPYDCRGKQLPRIQDFHPQLRRLLVQLEHDVRIAISSEVFQQHGWVGSTFLGIVFVCKRQHVRTPITYFAPRRARHTKQFQNQRDHNQLEPQWLRMGLFRSRVH